MAESTHEHDKCDLLRMIDGMISEFHLEFGVQPKSLCMGMSLVEHLYEHLRDQMKRDATINSANHYKGIPIRIIGYEDACFVELEMGQMPKFRTLLRAQEAEALEYLKRQMKNEDTTNH